MITEDRFGVLSEITRIIRENGLSIKRAEIRRNGGKAEDKFIVSDVMGNGVVDPKTTEMIQKEIGGGCGVKVEGDHSSRSLSTKLPKEKEETRTSFLFGNLFKGSRFHNFDKHSKSCS